MTGADLIVFPSDFEGFGLPAVEAMALGIPIVVGPDPEVAEVTAGQATTMADWSGSSLVESVSRALAQSESALERAREHAKNFTWTRAAAGTRDLLAEVMRRAAETG